MGIRDRPTPPRSPWQNGHIERLIGSIRRECLDHVVVLGEAHLRRILSAYADYYNGTRTHLALEKDAPLSRPVHAIGQVVAIPVLGGLHHQYAPRTVSASLCGLCVPKMRFGVDAGNERGKLAA
jgi:hypothetical protein